MSLTLFFRFHIYGGSWHIYPSVPGSIQLKLFPLFTLKAVSAAIAKSGVLTVPGFSPRLLGFEFQMCSLLGMLLSLSVPQSSQWWNGAFNSSYLTEWLPGWLSSKEFACQCMRCKCVPRVGNIPRGGNDNLLQHSCLENSMDRGAWQAEVHGTAKSDTTEPAHIWKWLEA